MGATFMIARVLHVCLGVFWVGVMVFNAAFLGPALRDAGSDGAKVFGALLRRRMLDIIPVVALLNILSGLYLYWRVSGGFSPAYMRSSMGMTFGVGSAAALAAFVIGMAIVRPSMIAASAQGQAAAAAAPEEEGALLAEAGALRARAGAWGQVVAWLLAGATLAMAVGRYV